MNKLLLGFFAALLLSSCQKKVDELPEATQTGANTFGAKVDGEFWIPQGFGPFPANDILEARMGGDDLTINARNFALSPTETEFVLYVKDVTTPGVYQLNTNTPHLGGAANYAYFVKRRLTPLDEWMTNSSYTGSVTITRIDQPNRIVSGTFQFNMINTSASQPMTVTDGRFDLRIQ